MASTHPHGRAGTHPSGPASTRPDPLLGQIDRTTPPGDVLLVPEERLRSPGLAAEIVRRIEQDGWRLCPDGVYRRPSDPHPPLPWPPEDKRD